MKANRVELTLHTSGIAQDFGLKTEVLIQSVDERDNHKYERWDRETYEQFRKNTTEELNHHEVICDGMPCKLFMDIEMKGDSKREQFDAWTQLRLRQVMVAAARECFTNAGGMTESDVIRMTRHRPGKLSCHLVIANWIAPNWRAVKEWFWFVQEELACDEFADAVDPKVYKRLISLSTCLSFNMAGQQLLLEDDMWRNWQFEDTMLSRIQGCEALVPIEGLIEPEVEQKGLVECAETQHFIDSIEAQGNFSFRNQEGNVWTFKRRRGRTPHCTLCNKAHEKRIGFT